MNQPFKLDGSWSFQVSVLADTSKTKQNKTKRENPPVGIIHRGEKPGVRKARAAQSMQRSQLR